MKYLTKITLAFFIIALLITCNEKSDKNIHSGKNKNEPKEKTIINDTTKSLIKDVKPKIEKEDTMKIPDEIDNFSEVIIYYESFIGKAYSKKEYDKFFQVNRKQLDSLIDKFEKKN